jgi:hypothetical protein
MWQQNFQMSSNRSSFLEDEAFVRLLTEVGRKLFLMEAKERSSVEDERLPTVEEAPPPPASSLGGRRSYFSGMGPIEKVEKWRETQQLSAEDEKAAVAAAAAPTGPNSNLPSCYGSCPTRFDFKSCFYIKNKNSLFMDLEKNNLIPYLFTMKVKVSEISY